MSGDSTDELHANARSLVKMALIVAGASALASGAALGIAQTFAKDPQRARSAIGFIAGFGAGYVVSRVLNEHRRAIAGGPVAQYAIDAATGAVHAVARRHIPSVGLGFAAGGSGT